jgi:hypothetical protein
MSNRIELVWPDKESRPIQTVSGGWTLEAVDERKRQAVPFEIVGSAGTESARSLVLQGDRLTAVRTLRPTLQRGFKLVYLDLPRIEGYDETRAFIADDGRTWWTWLAVVRHHMAAARELLARDGVMVIQGGGNEEAYARILADEILGPRNHLGTVVWQSHYSPKSGKLGSEIVGIHDTLLCYAQEADAVGAVALPKQATGYSNPDGDPRGEWKAPQKDAGRDTVKMTYNQPPYRWTLDKGELPPGFWRLSPFSGVIWGTPTEPGDFSFRVKVEDAKGNASSKTLHLVIEEGGDQTSLPERIWWMDSPPKKGDGKPKVLHTKLPQGSVGNAYSFVLEASGGAPTLGQKRPSRGWGFGEQKLIESIREDRCYFGQKGTSIPEPKRYLSALEDGQSYVNVTSWWPGEGVGWSQDATKHLRELKEVGIISRIVETAKPTTLMARLLDAFTAPGDLVLELFSQAGDLSATAVRMGRSFVALSGASERDYAVAAECSIPRIEAICKGDKRLTELAGAEVDAAPAIGGFTVADLRDPLATIEVGRDEFPQLITEGYANSIEIAEAVLTSQGYVPVDASDEQVTGVALGGANTAVALTPEAFLDRGMAAELAERLGGAGGRVTIYFFRSDDDLATEEFANAVTFRRLPMELSL